MRSYKHKNKSISFCPLLTWSLRKHVPVIMLGVFSSHVVEVKAIFGLRQHPFLGWRLFNLCAICPLFLPPILSDPSWIRVHTRLVILSTSSYQIYPSNSNPCPSWSYEGWQSTINGCETIWRGQEFGLVKPVQRKCLFLYPRFLVLKFPSPSV